MQQKEIYLLLHKCVDGRVLDSAKAPSQAHTGLMQSLDTIFHFVSQPPHPNIFHLPKQRS
jgi:hypothetical protein